MTEQHPATTQGATLTRIARTIALTAALILAGGTATASPTGVTYTQTAVYVAPGTPVTYTGSPYVCDKAPCTEQWVVFGPGYSRLGTPLGYGHTLVKAWSKAGSFRVQWRVTNASGTNGRATFNAYTVVQ